MTPASWEERALPDPPAGLSAAEAQALTEALETELQKQSELLDESLANVFEHIPWLLRGPVRRLAGA